jgi:glyoxylase-like metal-dependent hydrolase (beta-lactamase superfamily II)
MAFATGRHMTRPFFRHSFTPSQIADVVLAVHSDRVVFHDGDEVVAPGVSVHLIGGHTDGIQVVRVWTERGWLVLASDTSHYYENMETGRPFPIVFDAGAMIEGWDRLRELTDHDDAIVPGHDPLVLTRYPAAGPGLDGIAVRLDRGRIDAAG